MHIMRKFTFVVEFYALKMVHQKLKIRASIFHEFKLGSGPTLTTERVSLVHG